MRIKEETEYFCVKLNEELKLFQSLYHSTLSQAFINLVMGDVTIIRFDSKHLVFMGDST